MAKSPKVVETEASGVEQSSTESVTFRAGGRTSQPITVTFSIGHTLDELVAQFGEAIVATKAREKLVINLQDTLRNAAKKGEPDLQALADNWTPGSRVRGPRKSKSEKIESLFAGLSAEERRALMEKYAA